MTPQAASRPAAEVPQSAIEARPRLSIQVVRHAQDLKQHRDTWSDLAERAIEPNVFYEPVPFLAAIETLSDLQSFMVVLVYAEPGDKGSRGDELVGFIPFGFINGRPFGRLHRYELYHHLYSYLCTPLIDPRYLAPVVEMLLDWIASAPEGNAVFDLPIMTEAGPVWQAVRDGLERQGLAHFPLNRIHRALFRRQGSAEAFLRQSLRAKKRKELRRQRRRLEELGNVKLHSIGQDDNIDHWTEQFVKLEVSGWKSKSRHAFAYHPEQSRYFRRLLRETAANGSLIMLALTLDDKPIALKVSLRSAGQPNAAFAFKIAYDEHYARYSPGVQLELENIRQLHTLDPPVDWMDSCALPNQMMIGHLWRDRVGLAGVTCSGRDLLSRSRLALRKILED